MEQETKKQTSEEEITELETKLTDLKIEYRIAVRKKALKEEIKKYNQNFITKICWDIQNGSKHMLSWFFKLSKGGLKIAGKMGENLNAPNKNKPNQGKKKEIKNSKKSSGLAPLDQSFFLEGIK